MSPLHVLAMCTISELGGIVSGGEEGCSVCPSWAVIRHTRKPVDMTEASLSSRSEGISCAWTNSTVGAVSRLSEESWENQSDERVVGEGVVVERD